MSRFRYQRVGEALSESLGLFADRETARVTEQREREWQLSMQTLRDARADARSERDFQQRLALHLSDQANADRRAAAADSAASERATAANESRERIAGLNVDIRQSEFAATDVYNRERDLQRILGEYSEMEQQALEAAFDEQSQQDIRDRYSDIRDQAIVGHVLNMVGREIQSPGSAPGYSVGVQEELTGLLTRMGMDVEGADLYGQQIWGRIGDPDPVSAEGPTELLLPPPSAAPTGAGAAASPSPQPPVTNSSSPLFTEANDTAAVERPRQGSGTDPFLLSDPFSGVRNEGGNVNPLDLARGLFDSFAQSPFLNRDVRDANRQRIEQQMAERAPPRVGPI